MGSALQCELARGEVLAVTSRARIHCALLNTSGLFGRVDGGIGFSVEDPRWEIEVGCGLSPEESRLPPELLTAVDNALSKLQSAWKIPPLGIRVKNGIGAHTGLGSKTALLLAVGRAASILSGRRISAVLIAQLLGRGGTSGIGVHCFGGGGLVWDAGRAFPEEKRCFSPSSVSVARPPSAILHLPVKWLSVVHFRYSRTGPHGEDERRAFAERCPTPDSGTVKALVAVSSLILPGLVDRRENLLQQGLRKLQDTGFKKVEWAHQDLVTNGFRAYWADSKMPETLCLSSFGPTMYVLTSDPWPVVARINAFGEQPVHLTVTKVSNVGCQVRKE